MSESRAAGGITIQPTVEVYQPFGGHIYVVSIANPGGINEATMQEWKQRLSGLHLMVDELTTNRQIHTYVVNYPCSGAKPKEMRAQIEEINAACLITPISYARIGTEVLYAGDSPLPLLTLYYTFEWKTVPPNLRTKVCELATTLIKPISRNRSVYPQYTVGVKTSLSGEVVVNFQCGPSDFEEFRPEVRAFFGTVETKFDKLMGQLYRELFIP